MTTDTLRALREQRDRASATFEEAIVQAHAEGRPITRIATESGLSRQAIYDLLKRYGRHLGQLRRSGLLFEDLYAVPTRRYRNGANRDARALHPAGGEKPRRARKRLPARSVRRIEEDRSKPEIRRAVFDRDGWTCRLKGTDGVLAHSCSGLTVHHLLKASQGGGYTEGNLVTLCSVANDLIEDYPQRAWELGLVVRRGESTADAWVRMTAAGLVSPP